MTTTVKEWADIYNSDEFKQKYYYDGDDLGAKCMVGSTRIKLWSPLAESVNINFYKDGEPATKSYWSEPMQRTNNGVWEWHIHESLHKTYYDFTIVIDGASYQTGDPYARATGVNGVRSMVVDLDQTDPDGWGLDKAPALQHDQIISEIHVKEFSWEENAGWPEDVRGKYKAFAYGDTTLNDDGQTKTGINFSKYLGITHLQLMPVYDFGSVDESIDDDQFNWGYDPINYNVPEGSYSTDAHHGEVRIKELKEMIQSLHKHGFRVIMDVVYNHTYNLDVPLQKIAPYYFYRTWPDGSLSNGSGCGNDIASERSMVEKYIIDSVMYWAREYHMDGFRFDLMGLLTVDLMNKIQTKLDDKFGAGEKLIYGEPWSADKTANGPEVLLANKGNMGLLDKKIGMFCDDTRDSIKGSAGNLKATGFVNGAPGVEGRILSSIKAWCVDGSPVKAPSQIINYASAHDNQTLWDKLSETTPDEELRLRQYRLAVAIYMSCQGRPFMLSGSCFLRTKYGNDNSHNAPIEINRLDWNEVSEHQDMVEYYRGLIAIRQQMPGLYDKDINAKTRIGNTWATDGMVGFMVDNTDDEHTSPWEYLCIIFNRNQENKEVTLDEGEWEILANQDDTWLWHSPETVTGKITVDQVGWIMLGQRQAPDDEQ